MIFTREFVPVAQGLQVLKGMSVNMETKDLEAFYKELNSSDSVYILLSPGKADLIKGVSVPFVGEKEGENVLYLFDSIDKAKAFVDKVSDKNADDEEIAFGDSDRIESIDGVYLVGKADNATEFNSVKAISSVAIAMGINKAVFNSLLEDELIFSLDVFKEENDEQPATSFNPIKIIDFKDTFAIAPERKKELNNLIFNAGETYGDYANTYMGLTMLERCYLSDTCARFIAQAIQSGKKEDADYFRKVEGLIQVAVWNTLPEEKNLYTLIRPESGSTVIDGDAMYVLYTDRFKYMGKYQQRKLKDFKELQQMIIKYDIRKLIVTDGPHHMTLIARVNMLGID